MKDIKANKFTINSFYSIMGKEVAIPYLEKFEKQPLPLIITYNDEYHGNNLSFKVIAGGKKVGCVSNDCVKTFAGYFIGYANKLKVKDYTKVMILANFSQLLRNRESNIPYAMDITVDFGDVEPVEIEPVDYWADWDYSIIPLELTEEETQQKTRMGIVVNFITGKLTPSKDQLLFYIRQYLEKGYLDVSLENKTTLTKLASWLSQQEDEDLRNLVDEVKHIQNCVNTKRCVKERLEEWWPKKKEGKEAKLLWLEYWKSKGGTDNPTQAQLKAALEEMHRKLQNTPNKIWYKVKEGDNFFSYLFYLDTPLIVLQQVYGCIVMCSHIYNHLLDINEDEMIKWAMKQRDAIKASVVEEYVLEENVARNDPQLMEKIEKMKKACNVAPGKSKLIFNQPVQNAIGYVDKITSKD